tara:strand:- start:31165 stop:31482 length:318 start_codon:yes stop_codon:yes gene_type:complete
MTQEVTSESFDSLLSEKEVLVVDFWAPWCGPCKTLGPIIDSVNADIKDENVKVIKVNVDEHSELAAKYGIRSIPTVIYFKAGKLSNKTIGISSRAEIEDIIDSLK